MIVSHITIVTIFVVLLFAIPVLTIAINQNIFKFLSLPRLTRTFNRAFLIQVLIGLTIALISAILDKKYYSNGDGNIFAAIFIETTHTYNIIGVFMYLPGLIMLNLINWLRIKVKRAN
jgi:hypothetical protein